ncbi:MAG: nitrilase-related carbon-nitrogen hydrolase [Flavobacteriaceae bacterium]|nr:nitrilase-related carbon-nitrogen hydrolase [Flavobacteriaceae bacterium]
MKIALVSLNQIWEEKKVNKINCSKYIKDANLKSCDLIIFPEMTLTGFSLKNASSLSENMLQSTTLTFFKNEAVTNNIAIVFGLIARENDENYNKLIFLSNKGEVIGDYNKIHPFSFSNENLFFKGGNKIQYSFFGGVNWGLSICFDLRFPEIYQIQSPKAEVIINIANWPEKRHNHWKTLIQARAIENQVYFIGVNRTGIDGNGLLYKESSMIVNPNGEIEKEILKESELKVYDLNLDLVKKVRDTFPLVDDRKKEFYKKYY